MTTSRSAPRRPMGSLEAEVLGFLWQAPRPVTPAEVLDGLGVDLAYTTIMTILTRLWRKGLVERQHRGRAYAYMARLDEADYVARSMRDALDHASDHTAALGRFVATLSKRDARTLRTLVADRPIA